MIGIEILPLEIKKENLRLVIRCNKAFLFNKENTQQENDYFARQLTEIALTKIKNKNNLNNEILTKAQLVKEANGFYYNFFLKFTHKSIQLNWQIDLCLIRNGKLTIFEIRPVSRITNAIEREFRDFYSLINDTSTCINLWYINKDYIIESLFDWYKYFHKVKIKKSHHSNSKPLLNRLSLLSENINKKVETIKHPLGRYCYLPEKCSHFESCFPHTKKQTVLELAGLPFEIKWKNRFRHAKDLNLQNINNEFNVTSRVKFAVDFLNTNEVFEIQKNELINLFSQISKPAIFLDFESIMPYLPILPGTSPFMPLLIQYSMTILNEQKGEAQQKSFIANIKIDANGIKSNFTNRKTYYKELMQNMFADLPNVGTIFVYDNGFEASILRKIKTIVPQFSNQIDDLLSRMVDFMEIFKKHWYYHKDQLGSISLKKVLPLLVPELNYDSLEVQDGGQAVKVFFQYLDPNLNDARKKVIHQQLIDYCNFDTYTMSRMYQNLQRLLNNKAITGHKKSGLLDRFINIFTKK